MPRTKRNFQPNSYYHIYNRGNNKDAVLKHSSDKQIFVNLLYRHKNECNIKLVNYCIMDNHFHLIVKTNKDPKNLSKYMQKVLTSFAIQINRKHQRIGHAFQGRYNANLLPYKKDFIRTRDYINKNPVVEGLVRKPSEYPWLKD